MDTITPDEHSDVVGGSTAGRRIGCPRSYALEKLVPKDPGNIHTRQGTALHEMIAVVLGQDKHPDDLLPFTYEREGDDVEGSWSFTVSEALWYDLGQPALDAFDNFVDDIEKETGEAFEFVVETRCAMPGIEGAFGTADIIWRCGEYSGVLDWKFGRNPVSAEANPQAMFYGRAAASTMPWLFTANNGPEDGITYERLSPTRQVILSIIQPQASDTPDEYIVELHELEAYRVKLMAAVKQAVAEGETAPVAKGKWCDYATCKAVCPLWAGRTAEFGAKMAALEETRKAQGAKSLDLVTETDEASGAERFAIQDDLPDLLDLAEVAQEWARTVFGIAHNLAEQGAPPEGWRLKPKASSGRVWTVSDDKVREFMKNRRYKLDEYMPRKLKSMPQIEALVKKDGRTIPEDMYQKKPSSGTTLVRDESDAPNAEISSERAKALGEKIAALGGETE